MALQRAHRPNARDKYLRRPPRHVPGDHQRPVRVEGRGRRVDRRGGAQEARRRMLRPDCRMPHLSLRAGRAEPPVAVLRGLRFPSRRAGVVEIGDGGWVASDAHVRRLRGGTGQRVLPRHEGVARDAEGRHRRVRWYVFLH